MKWSKYSFFFESEGKYLLYNSLSNSFAELDAETYSYLKNQKKEKDVVLEDTNLLEDLKFMKVVVDNEADEFNAIKFQTLANRFHSGTLSLTINPTLDCNFACPYCFEANHVYEYMTEEVEDLLLDFIKKKKGLHTLRVTWFGGEPLMAFDKIKNLTKRFKELGLTYKAGMITNGYLMTEEVINQLAELEIRSLQITLDGFEKSHDSRRFLRGGGGTFHTIMNNIDLLKKLEPDIHLAIRVNVDENNKDEFVNLYEFLKSKNYPSTRIDPAFVTDFTSSCKNDGCIMDRKRKINFLVSMNKQYKLNFTHFFPLSYRQECGARNPNSMVIGPTGEIYKCWNDVGNKNKIVASLTKAHEVNNKLLFRYLVGADPLESKKCLSCFHLPTCGGGCPYLRIENEYEGQEFDVCDYIKGNMKEFLELHYQTKSEAEKAKETETVQ